MSSPVAIDTKKVSVRLVPHTRGTANVHDDQLTAKLDAAKQGGHATQDYFDSSNQTADYWTWITNTTQGGDNPFAPGVDPDGHPIVMSSNGNLNMRLGAFHRESGPAQAADSDDPPVVGIATIQTHNTTSGLSGEISFGLGLTGIPAGIVLSKKLFADLLQPVYANVKTAVTKLATRFRESAETESPEIDPEEEVEDPLADASGELEEIGGELAEEGAEYLAVDWADVGLEVAGLGALAAIPLIVGYLGHKMVNSVVIHNLTDHDFTWSVLDQVHGQASVLPGTKKQGHTLPKMDYNVDSWGDRTTVKVAYEDNFQFINSSDLGSIGWVLGLTPTAGGTQAKLVASIPWAGANTIWVGESDDSPDAIYAAHSDPDERSSVAESFGDYKVTMAINKLSGKTQDQYFYGIVVVVEPD